MRLTELQLRRVIRNLIKESTDTAAQWISCYWDDLTKATDNQAWNKLPGAALSNINNPYEGLDEDGVEQLEYFPKRIVKHNLGIDFGWFGTGSDNNRFSNLRIGKSSRSNKDSFEFQTTFSGPDIRSRSYGLTNKEYVLDWSFSIMHQNTLRYPRYKGDPDAILLANVIQRWGNYKTPDTELKFLRLVQNGLAGFISSTNPHFPLGYVVKFPDKTEKLVAVFNQKGEAYYWYDANVNPGDHLDQIRPNGGGGYFGDTARMSEKLPFLFNKNFIEKTNIDIQKLQDFIDLAGDLGYYKVEAHVAKLIFYFDVETSYGTKVSTKPYVDKMKEVLVTSGIPYSGIRASRDLDDIRLDVEFDGNYTWIKGLQKQL